MIGSAGVLQVDPQDLVLYDSKVGLIALVELGPPPITRIGPVCLSVLM